MIIKLFKYFYICLFLTGCGHFLNPMHKGFWDWNDSYLYEESRMQVINICREKYSGNEELYKRCLFNNNVSQ
ncbi:hypothetical protein BKK51_07315 [Rodentibacter trehalosifermentans]|uniref:Lipoprotein n=1 Tax=Rodentibacter trehalosifermentans TaxID=1908263 RepID=A0A1V3IS60_9PAST|nr:hypothetical protein BKK51_07315 [Rodentibacter trehalosifermentans]OOF47219.1 hypothetical protein BKK53_11485 [Rodentibacter trehalosifermentans]OOF47510.1 hypothetical protein BKK52_09020 [Rodentibacter trehalosifermentans]